MIDVILLLASFGLFISAIGMLMYDAISPKIDRSKELGRNLPKYTKKGLLLLFLSFFLLIITTSPYATRYLG